MGSGGGHVPGKHWLVLGSNVKRWRRGCYLETLVQMEGRTSLPTQGQVHFLTKLHSTLQMHCAFFPSRDFCDPVYLMVPVWSLYSSNRGRSQRSQEHAPAQCARSLLCLVPPTSALSPGSSLPPPVLRTPLPLLPEKSMYSVEHIGSLPPGKKLALEIFLLR